MNLRSVREDESQVSKRASRAEGKRGAGEHMSSADVERNARAGSERASKIAMQLLSHLQRISC